MKPPNNSRGFSALPALVSGRTAQKLGIERQDPQLATAGVALEGRARAALRNGAAMLAPLKPAAALSAPADPDEIWGNAGIAALQELKGERG